MPFGAVLAGDVAAAVDVLSGMWATANAARSRPAGRAAGVEVWDGPDAVSMAASQWHRLEQTGAAGTGFQRLALAQTSARAHLELGETPRVVLVHEHGHPLVLLATASGRRAGLRVTRFLGDPLIQYGDALAATGAKPKHVAAALQAAATDTDLLWLRRVRADAHLAPVLAARFALVAQTSAPFVSLRGDAMPWTRHRRELQRRRRRLQEHGDLGFEILHGAKARRTVTEALALKRRWLDARGLPGSVVGVTAWESVLMCLAASVDGPLAAARLTVGGRLAAAEIALVHAGHWYAFLGAYDEAFAAAGPGHIQMNETMAHGAAAGLSTYDLLPPGDAYKDRLACGTVPVGDHALPVTAAGRLGLLALRTRPMLKAAIERLPAPVRRVLVAVCR